MIFTGITIVIIKKILIYDCGANFIQLIFNQYTGIIFKYSSAEKVYIQMYCCFSISLWAYAQGKAIWTYDYTSYKRKTSIINFKTTYLVNTNIESFKLLNQMDGMPSKQHI